MKAWNRLMWGMSLYLGLQLIWPTPAGVVAQGVIIGAITALVSYGLALIYRANRIINFAQADLGAVPASLGVLLIVSAGWSFWVAVPMALLAGAALGAVIELLFIRRFSRAPRLILMVVTIGLSQILAGLGTALPFLFGEDFPPQDFPSPFDFSFEIDPILFRGNDLIAVLAVPLVVIGLTSFLRYTRIGIAIRAAAESADRAALLGINVGRTQSIVWVVAALLSSLAMLLRAGILGLPLGSAFGPSILLRALAAAVIGRMERFPTMFAAACGLGILETAIIWNEDSATLVDPVIFIAISAFLLFQRRGQGSRVEDQAISTWQVAERVRPMPRELVRLPEVVWAKRAVLGLLAAVVLALPAVLSDGKTNLASAVFVFGMIAVSLVVLTGWAGEISLGQVAFVAIGSAVGGALNAHYQLDITLVLLASGLVGAAGSILIGLPALRIRGLFLAVSTMAFALATSSYLLNPKYFGYLSDNVSERVQRLPAFGFVDIASETAFFYTSLVVLLVMLWSVRGLQRTRAYRVLVATRENELAAQAFGLSITRAKLLAFAMSGFYASAAGGLFVLHQRAVGEQVFEPAQSLRALTMVVIGGLGSVPGALLGAVFLKSTEWFSTMVPRDYRFFFTFAGSGIGLILVLMFLPGGLGSVIYRARDGYLRLVARRRGIQVPSLDRDGPTDTSRSQVTSLTAAPSARSLRPQSTRVPFRWIPRHRAPDLDYLSFPDLVVGGGEANLLSIRSIDVAYGPVQVLFGVNLELVEGEIIALLGTNGAGKSTVLRAVSGLVRATSGSMSLDGRDINGMAPHRVAELGVIQVPGGRGVFPSLTVRENLSLGGWLHRRDSEASEVDLQRVLDLFPILRERLDQPAANLSGGQQQMLTLAMAFLTRPRVLMIDELSLGLAPVIVAQLLEVVKKLRDEGTTVIIVEQSVNVALTIADTAYFMEKGEIRFHGPTAELLERPEILRSVFLRGASTRGDAASTPRDTSANGAADADKGVRVPARVVAPDRPERAVILEAVGITKSFAGNTAISDLSLQLHAGEILGVIGPNGAGKTTMFDLISGVLAPDSGSVHFMGRDITSLRPQQRSLLGLARSFQDARMFPGLTVHQAMAVALDRTLEVRDPVAAALNLPAVLLAEERLGLQVDDMIELLGLTAYRDKFIGELSTGSRRIVDLGCQIALNPRVILFDEPSSGIAQRETEALGPLLLRIRDDVGASLLVIEHDMPMLRAISDRLLALDLGCYVTDGDAADVLDHPHVVSSYLGTNRDVVERSGATEGAA